MSTPVRRNELQNAVRTFLGYLQDLQEAGFEQSRTKLRLVMNYSQRDPVTHALAEQLLLRMPTESVVQRVAGGFDLPNGHLDQLAFGYSLLYQLKLAWKLELRELLSRDAFRGGGLEPRWQDFKRQVLDPVVRGVKAIADWIEDDAQPDHQQLDAGQVFRYALLAYEGSQPAGIVLPLDADTDTLPAAPAPQREGETETRSWKEAPVLERPELPADFYGPSLTALREASPAVLAVDVDLLAVELQKRAPDPDALAALCLAFAGTDTALMPSVVACVLEWGRASGERSKQKTPTKKKKTPTKKKKKKTPTKKKTSTKKKKTSARSKAKKRKT